MKLFGQEVTSGSNKFFSLERLQNDSGKQVTLSRGDDVTEVVVACSSFSSYDDLPSMKPKSNPEIMESTFLG